MAIRYIARSYKLAPTHGFFVASPYPLDTMNTHSSPSNKNAATGQARDSWRTPEFLYEALDREFGFDLDPCPFQPDWTPGVHQNGLDLDWNGKKVFVNPSYSNILPWVQKAFASAALTVFVLPAWTDRDWFHLLLNRGAEIRYFRHRVNFIAPRGIKPSSNRDGSIVAIVRNFPQSTAF